MKQTSTICLLAALLFARLVAVAALEDDFRRPPASARPWINWFWLDGNITREGITADLEAMQRVGIGGVLIMDVTQGIPAGPVRFGSPKWDEMFHYATAEAQRLGLGLNMHNAPGWCGSGGPWVTPEFAMQQLVWSKTNLIGPLHFDGILPPLNALHSYRRDVAVLAFPTLAGDGADSPGFAPRLTANISSFDGKPLLDRNLATFVKVTGKSVYIQMEFTEPFEASRFALTTARPQSFSGALQTSTDGRSFSTAREFIARGTNTSLIFPPTTSKFFRFLFPKLEQPIELAEIELTPVIRIDSAGAKSGLGPPVRTPARTVAVPSGSFIPREQITNLTSRMDPSGRLTWDVPEGNWTILRMGHAPSGQRNSPPQPEGLGLECDKLSKEAVAAHFLAFISRLKASETNNPAFGFVHVDSWEFGYQNWTPRFAEEFRQLCGYDPIPRLPTFSGRVVENAEISERFLWDVRRTIAHLVKANYAGQLASLAHERGLKLSIEAYSSLGSGPFDSLTYGGQADQPMGEFWAESNDLIRFGSCRIMASAAHTHNRPIVGAEAFSAWPAESRWINHPFTLKALADGAFCEGINLLYLQSHPLQPWLNRKPGMTFGWWGVHYDRTETWWEFSRPWHEYLARCQHLLQQGKFTADVCYLMTEEPFVPPPKRDDFSPPLPAGYDYDMMSPQTAIDHLSVTNGSLILPDGLSYRVLVLPQSETMTPPLLRKIKTLIESGATVIGPRPTKSPSLANHPQCDEEVKQLAQTVWQDCDGRTVKQRPVGLGQIVWGKSLAEVFAQLKLPADFAQKGKISGQPLRTIHRRLLEGELYFISNPNNTTQVMECAFRVTGKRPEYWYPETGRIERVLSYREESGQPIVPLKLEAAGSIFVMFRSSAASESNPTLSHTETKSSLPAMPIEGSWEVKFTSGWGAPDSVTFDKLISWSEHANPGVRYFSGTATYLKSFVAPVELGSTNCRWYLDLGAVEVIADVSVNGKSVGIAWKPPYRIDITDAMQPGDNSLAIKVVNLWPNRLIGDEQLPEDCTWMAARNKNGLFLTAWPQWLLEGKPSPTGRFTFSTWKHWDRNATLLRSGLIGPVKLEPIEISTIK